MTDAEQKRIFAKNLTSYLAMANKSQKEVADAIGVSPQTFNAWCQAIALPRMGKVQKLADYFHIEKSDLIDAKNEYSSNEEHPFISESAPDYSSTATPEEFDSLIKPYRDLDESGKNHIQYEFQRETARMKALAERDKRIEKMEMEISEQLTPKRILAYYGKIAAAGKSFGFDDIVAGTKIYPLTKDSEKADYTIGISGDSMEPTFYDGDIVYVQKTDYLNIGDIGIFQKDNSIYIKEVGENGLISHNKKYPPMINGGDAICLGKVLGKAAEE